MTSNIDLAYLTTAQGFKILGANSNDMGGRHVGIAGDFNGDGYSDIVVESPISGSSSGTAYLIFGKAAGFSDIDLANLSTTQGLKIFGAPQAVYGRAISNNAGDFNNDGYDDIIIGNGRSQTTYLLFGKASGFSDINLLSLTSTDGFKVADIGNGGLGFSVSAGDFNGDGYSDIITGSVTADANFRTDSGEAYVIYGKASGFSDIDLTSLDITQGFKILGAASGNYIYSVSSAGDMNNDGYDDIIIGSPYATVSSKSNAGTSYVIFGNGTNRADIDLATLAMPTGFKILGASGDQCGFSVSAAGDFNNDGYKDIVIGASFASPYSRGNAGTSYVIFGKESGFSDIDLSTLTNTQGFKILGATTGDGSGWSVSTAGDVNNDGYDDVIIGAYAADPNSRTDAGISYIIYGKASGFTDIDLAALDTTQGFKILGSSTYDYNGFSVSGAGDINGDGYSDVLTGAPLADPNSRADAGTSYVIYGSASPTVTPTFTPTTIPTAIPTPAPTLLPTTIPTLIPITIPTAAPTLVPTITPTLIPTSAPTISTIYITNGGTYTGTTESENFVINSPLSVTITGGGGIDTFKVFSNNDVTFTITDFNPINERIDLTSFTDIYKKADLNITKGSVIITLPNSQIIKLLSLSPSDIASGNFIFSTIPPTTTPTIAPTLAPTITTSHDKGISSELSIGAIVGIAVGGTALLIACGYIMYTKLFSIGSSSQTVGTIPEILEKGTTLDQYPSASNYELVAIEPSAPPHIPIAYAVGDTLNYKL